MAYEKSEKIKKRSRHSHDSKRPRRPRAPGFCSFMKYLMVEMWILIHACLDWFINQCFGLYYQESLKQVIPTVKESFLMESAVSLAEKVRNKEVTSEALVKACIERINDVNPMLNAVVDNRYVTALEEARAIDKLLASNTLSAEEIKLKPFLGVPFTTKESTSCQGMQFSLGLVSRKFVKATEDADAVKLLKKAGGILIANTNIPVVNLWCETGNNVYGYTNNPYNTTRTVGGSSGGEAAIIAAAGSPMGIGTDIGGSIRMPAFYCGIFGHKPTTGVCSLKGLTFRKGDEGRTMVCVGPMSRYAQDLMPFFKVLLGDNVSLLPRLNDKVNIEDVKVCYMTETRDVRHSRVNRDMKAALEKVVEHFSNISNHSVEKLHLAEMKYAFRLWRYWQAIEPGPGLHVDLANRKGKVNTWTETFKKLTCQSEFTLACIMKMIDCHLPQEKAEWAEATTESLRQQIIEHLGENGVMLFPSHPFPASYHYSSYLRPYNFTYWGVFNALNLPVTQVPLGLDAEGLPVGIQVVAAPYQDHLCLAVARELQQTFGGWVPPFSI